MAGKVKTATSSIKKPHRYVYAVLAEQILWLIKLRWLAVIAIIIAALAGTYVFPVLPQAMPICICAAILLLSNILYYWLATKQANRIGSKDISLAMAQVEADLIILTAVLYFSGGVVNPFFFFFIFHVIIATIILPRNLSFVVGLTTILFFGLLAVNELNGGAWLRLYPLRLSASGGLWRNPVYVLGAFVAFACTVVLAQYLTRIIIVRMRGQEIEVARNRDLLEAVIGAMSEGLIFVTREGNVAVCNPAARLWKEYRYLRAGDDSLHHFPSALREHIKALVKGRDRPAEIKKVIEFTTSNPEPRYIEAVSCSVPGVDGEELGYVIVGQDWTEHKKLEKDLLERTEDVTAINEMLKMSRIEMAQREKMVAIGQMATGIAHEIGNPLASLSSVAQYLGRKLTRHEEKEHLLRIEYQVNRISNILKRMLSLSRPATAEYKWVDINELIDNTLSLVRFDKRMKSVNVENIANAELPMVWLNPQSFEQVLLNIFINAMDAMDSKKSDDGRVLKVTRQFSNEMVEVRVSDTGIGMNPDICKRAFESFFTTKDIGKGTGLGLFISYNLIAEIDGTIELRSEPDEGTMVIIRIPVRPKKHLIEGDGMPDVKGATGRQGD